MIQSYVQMAIALAGVLGLILLMGHFAKKKQEKPGLMKVMAYQSLGQKKGIAAVKIGREVLLLAVTATDLKLLKSMDDHCFDNVDASEAVQEINDKLVKLKTLKGGLYAGK